MYLQISGCRFNFPLLGPVLFATLLLSNLSEGAVTATVTEIANLKSGIAAGVSVSISANYIVVGAPAAAKGDGRVFILDLNGNLLQTLPAPNDAKNFGISVCVRDGAGQSYLIVGANLTRSQAGSPPGEGAAYTFLLQGAGAPVDAGALNLPATAPQNERWRFGSSVAICESPIQGGNIQVALVGSPGAGEGGRVYVYERRNDAWGAPAIWDSTTSGAEITGADFGKSVALDGNVAVVGAPGSRISRNPGTSSNPGVVYARYWNPANNGAWRAEVDPVSPQRAAAKPDARSLLPLRFGESVAVAKSGNNYTILVGAPMASRFKGFSGAAYFYDLVYTGGAPRANPPGFNSRITPPDPATPAADKATMVGFFGSSVGLNYVNSEAIIGAPWGDSRRHGGKGVIYLARKNGTWTIEVPAVEPQNRKSSGNMFGSSVAATPTGDFKAVVGARGENTGKKKKHGNGYTVTRRDVIAAPIAPVVPHP